MAAVKTSEAGPVVVVVRPHGSGGRALALHHGGRYGHRSSKAATATKGALRRDAIVVPGWHELGEEPSTPAAKNGAPTLVIRAHRIGDAELYRLNAHHLLRRVNAIRKRRSGLDSALAGLGPVAFQQLIVLAPLGERFTADRQHHGRSA